MLYCRVLKSIVHYFYVFSVICSILFAYSMDPSGLKIKLLVHSYCIFVTVSVILLLFGVSDVHNYALCCLFAYKAIGSATSAQHVRPSGIRCRWPDDLQRSAR